MNPSQPNRVMPARFWRGALAGVASLLIAGVCPGWAIAQVTFGSLSNFDVFNDTGEETHGFEIEFDSLSSADIAFTFGSPYQRYGDPVVEDFAGGVYVRYRSPYDPVNQVFTAATPKAPSVITPTDGHACWTGGSGDYLTSGCEHFGVGVNGSPTQTVYRWLIADPANPGSLMASGTRVSIPAPIWNVAPAQPGRNPVVQAVVVAEPPEAQQEYGDATWVKVFVTETETEVELHHLVTDDPAVPKEESETEIEWVILQAGPPGKPNNELGLEGEIGAGKKSITRRYEFYEYSGAYDPESHEALCAGPRGCDLPLPSEIGNYIGAQMAALNLGPEPPTPTPTETPEPTATATVSVTPTATATATATATTTAMPATCVGDCHGGGTVAIDELITLVSIALGAAEPTTCAEGIPAGATLDIALLIRAVNNALSGCPVV